MKVLFMGTPDFAAGALKSLIDNGHEVVLVVTQTDKPKGRGKEVQYTPVKKVALEHGIEVFQPVKAKEPESVAKLRESNADVFVVAAYGQILTQEILDIPRYGCVNIHASLLPKYRGAAPIQWSIIDGEEVTGVTTMMMDAGIDTGDMLDKVEVTIADDETGGTLHDKLMEAGAKLIIETLEKLENGTITRIKQNDEDSCYAKMLDKKMGNIDFSNPAWKIERLIRGLNPWPSAYTRIKGKNLKIYQAKVIYEEYEGIPGEIVYIDKNSMYIKTGDGILDVKNLQLEGKKAMDIADFLRGNNIEKGTILGE